MYVTDVSDTACAYLQSVLRLGVDKDHRTYEVPEKPVTCMDEVTLEIEEFH